MDQLDNAEIQQIEVEINFYKGQAVQSIFEIGERLIKAKELVEHGEWEDWLKNKVDFSNQQARRLMQVSREYPNRSVASGLSQTKIFELLAVPKEERETFIEENPVEDMTTRELRQAIKDKKELEEKIKQLENQEPKTITVEKEVIPKEVQAQLKQLEATKEQLEKLQVESKRLKGHGKSMQDLQYEIDQLSKRKAEQELAYNEMTIMADQARQIQNIETARKRFIRRVQVATDDLRKQRYSIEELYQEVGDVGVAGKRELIKEVKFLREMADIFEAMAGNDNVINTTYEMIEGEVING